MFRSLKRSIHLGLAEAQEKWRNGRATLNPSPVIVLGNQKSGTSAIAVLLAEMTGLSATIDLLGEGQKPSLPRVWSGDMTMATYVGRHRHGFSRQLIKEPSLSMFYDGLKACFPNATFIMVMRDPRDNIRSILNRHKFPGDQKQLTVAQRSQLSQAWQLVYDGTWLGLEGTNYIEMLAARWNLIADIYLNNTNDICLARYETFLEDKVAGIRRIADALGLEARHDISERVDVPFQPRGQRNVNLAEFFGPNLSRIEAICSERMEALGYARAH